MLKHAAEQSIALWSDRDCQTNPEAAVRWLRQPTAIQQYKYAVA